MPVKQPQAIDVGRAEGPRFAEDGGPAPRLVDLESEREIAGKQLQAEGHAVGMQAGGHEMIQVLPFTNSSSACSTRHRWR